MTPYQQKLRILAREAKKLGEDRAPSVVDERILPPALDEIANYAGDLMGKLTNLDAEDNIAVEMAHGILYDALASETLKQLQKMMLKAAEQRFKKKKK
jgi:hypothetical protein